MELVFISVCYRFLSGLYGLPFVVNVVGSYSLVLSISLGRVTVPDDWCVLQMAALMLIRRALDIAVGSPY